MYRVEVLQRRAQPAGPSQIMIGQMYVQFQIPQNKKRNMPPVIMVHGSSHTAACLESTPDGREGMVPSRPLRIRRVLVGKSLFFGVVSM